ncbi:hypothetical protein ACFQE1_09415 [Halobium palmae]|uniref:Halobacterial output domain-containing protein n=1 Tax=Halobium palmae TaxID=1776492 RepID=A0ABD5S098_9EURY
MSHGRDKCSRARRRTAGIHERARFLGRDPPRAEVRYVADDAELTLVLNDSLTVVESERTDR